MSSSTIPQWDSAGLLWQVVGALDILRLVPAHDNGSIQLYQASLTTREQRELGRAERTIARGLKSFLEVGLALKAIRDQRASPRRGDFGAFFECIQCLNTSPLRQNTMSLSARAISHTSRFSTTWTNP
jgi:hypothetical protein